MSLAFLAGCGKNDRPATTGSSATPQSSQPSSANSGKTERSPVQGQVDPKEGAQSKDFKTDGK
ncbi:hypothetical protein AYO46_01290 [Betaproteobacteria bacterium SCGC AG-212-J23]|nr:hypothetical protein AYO46_01290 [Betaproteobacteria bacterium SCGC AG-212-J23]